MASILRMSRYKKIATLTGVGGAFYLLRDDIKSLLGYSNRSLKNSSLIDSDNANTPARLIESLPEKVPYLLVGGGAASHSAMRAIRGHDPKAKVLIVSAEDHSPYMRPALSKELWFVEQDLRQKLKFKWFNGKERSIFFEHDEFYLPLDVMDKRETGGVSLIKNMRVKKLEPSNNLAFFDNGQTIKYDKCLLAPGGKPKSLPEFDRAPQEAKDRIVHFRTAEDFLRLEKIAETAKSIAVIGGGFLGSELACALGKRVPEDKVPDNQIIYQIFPESGNLGKVLPQHLSEYVTGKVSEEGVKVVASVEIISVTWNDTSKLIEIKLSNNEILRVEYVVAAVGLEPDVELAKTSGLEVDERTGGFLVNAELEARTNVWISGDASCFYDIKLGRRRIEHHDHAVQSGRLAGQNMVGFGKPYLHQSMFWSDLGSQVAFEAVGLIDSSLQTVSVFAHPADVQASQKPEEESSKKDDPQQQQEKVLQKPDITATDNNSNNNNRNTSDKDEFVKGIVFYLNKDNVIVGILTWNLFNRLTIARRILNEQRVYDDFSEVAKLFNIYLDDD